MLEQRRAASGEDATTGNPARCKEMRGAGARRKRARVGVCGGIVCVSVNDPSAGSPTETLLRLLLPRNVQI